MVCGRHGALISGSYEGVMVLDASGDGPLKLLYKGKGGNLTRDDDDPFYAGRRVDAIVRLYAISSKKKGGTGLFAGLEGVPSAATTRHSEPSVSAMTRLRKSTTTKNTLTTRMTTISSTDRPDQVRCWFWVEFPAPYPRDGRRQRRLR